MDVSWKVSFSGRTVGRQFIVDALPKNSVGTLNHMASDYEKEIVHDGVELLSKYLRANDWQGIILTAGFVDGLRGYRFHEDRHPRRRLALYIIM